MDDESDLSDSEDDKPLSQIQGQGWSEVKVQRPPQSFGATLEILTGPKAQCEEVQGMLDMIRGWTESDEGYKEPGPCRKKQCVNIGRPGKNITEGEAFSAVFSQSFFRLLKEGTNSHARQALRENPEAKWDTVKLSDIRKFLAMVFHMALVQKPSLHHYFSTDPVFHSPFPKHIGLSRNKFYEILRYLHVGSSKKASKRKKDLHKDVLAEVHPMVDMLVEHFQSLYTPSDYLGVDKVTVSLRGKLDLDSNGKNKPGHSYMWLDTVCNAPNGVVINFEVNMNGGKQKCPTSMVSRLLSPFKQSNHRVLIDECYGSPELYELLLEQGFYPLGVINSTNKSLPSALHHPILRWNTISRRKKQLLAIRWKDRCNLIVLSTMHKDETVRIESRSKSQEVMMKPTAVLTYEKYKNRMDLRHQLISHHPMKHSTIKKGKKLLLHLIMVGTVYACKYYNIKNQCKISMTDFMSKVITRLISDIMETDVTSDYLRSSPSSLHLCRYIDGDHFPVTLPPTVCKPYAFR